jgi:hypothetical protein
MSSLKAGQHSPYKKLQMLSLSDSCVQLLMDCCPRDGVLVLSESDAAETDASFRPDLVSFFSESDNPVPSPTEFLSTGFCPEVIFCVLLQQVI